MYFNVSQLTPCVLIIIIGKWLTTISICTQRWTLGYLHIFSRGNSYSDIGFCQDHCNYALVPHPPQNRKQFGKGFEDISVIFTVVPTLHIKSQGNKGLGEGLSRHVYGEFQFQHVLKGRHRAHVIQLSQSLSPLVSRPVSHSYSISQRHFHLVR